MRVLFVTSEWPASPGDISGIQVVHQAERLRQAGLDLDVYSFRGRASPRRYAQAIARFHKVNDFSRFDLIHAHHGQSGIVALSQRRLPVVVTFHGSDLQGIRNTNGRYTVLAYLLRTVSQMVARLATEVIVVSKHLARYLPRRDYHIIPAGIDLDLFRPMPQDYARQNLGLPQDGRLVLFVGDPARPEKRHALAEQATIRLSRQLNARLVVGTGIPHGQMPVFMNACDVLLVTSSHEGSPNAVKEALACNLPVVSTDVGDVRQRIGPLCGCVVCSDDHPSTIAAGLAKVLEQRVRIDGRAAVRHLDERLLAQKVIQVYTRAISGWQR